MCAGPSTSRDDRCELKLGAVGIAVERRMRLKSGGRKHLVSIWEMHLTNAEPILASLTGRRNCGTPARCINNCRRVICMPVLQSDMLSLRKTLFYFGLPSRRLSRGHVLFNFQFAALRDGQPLLPLARTERRPNGGLFRGRINLQYGQGS